MLGLAIYGESGMVIKSYRTLVITLFFLIVLLLLWLIVFAFGYMTYTSPIIDVYEYEQQRIQGFKTGFYVGAFCSYVVTITCILIIVCLKKMMTIKSVKSDCKCGSNAVGCGSEQSTTL